MDDLKWRHKARIVALVDLIFWIDMLLVVLLLSCVVGYATAYPEVLTDDPVIVYIVHKLPSKVELWKIQCAVALLALITADNLLASIMLLSATQLKIDVNEARRKAVYWDAVFHSSTSAAVAIVSYVTGCAFLNVVLGVLMKMDASGWMVMEIMKVVIGMGFIVWRLYFHSIVRKYIKEL